MNGVKRGMALGKRRHDEEAAFSFSFPITLNL
jgi:hypothetical protein